jgi:hypothetical protein
VPINPVNVGAAPNDGTGDTLRGAFVKVNANESDLDGRVNAAQSDATGALAGLADKVDTTRLVGTQHSLQGGGNLSANRTLSLVGDVATPGSNKVYGTDASGVRGWKDDPASAGGFDAAGDGLASSGSTVSLATPTTLTTSTANAATVSGHTHEVVFPVSGAGNGVTLSNGQIALGTPTTLTTGTTNSVTTSSHTHAVTFPVANVGNGLSLASAVASLGTPSTITNSTTNSTTASSHTHSLTLPQSMGVIDTYSLLYPNTNITSGSTRAASGLGSWYAELGSNQVFSVGAIGNNLSGTWRNMSAQSAPNQGGVLWLRIS